MSDPKIHIYKNSDFWGRYSVHYTIQCMKKKYFFIIYSVLDADHNGYLDFKEFQQVKAVAHIYGKFYPLTGSKFLFQRAWDGMFPPFESKLRSSCFWCKKFKNYLRYYYCFVFKFQYLKKTLNLRLKNNTHAIITIYLLRLV